MYAKYLLLMLLLFVWAKKMPAQNFVPNSGFEQITTLPCNQALSATQFGGNSVLWNSPSLGTPDLLSLDAEVYCWAYPGIGSTYVGGACQGGMLAPFEGNAMAGLTVYGPNNPNCAGLSEYLQIKLNSQLYPGETYCVEMRIALAPQASLATNNIGLAFVAGERDLNTCSRLNWVPDITEPMFLDQPGVWTVISDTVSPDTLADYMILGKFDQGELPELTSIAGGCEELGAYYYIDALLIRLLSNSGISGVRELCEGDTLTLDGGLSTDATYVWQDGSTRPFIRVTEAGTYWVEKTLEACTIREMVEVRMKRLPAEPWPNDSLSICVGETFMLDANQETTAYLWQDGSTESVFQVNGAGQVSVELTNECGGITDSIWVEERLCECTIFMPNAFSPNGDGHNEAFAPGFDCAYEQAHLVIYNRWGRIVFQTTDLESSWDGKTRGKPNPEGVYLWALTYTAFEAGRSQSRIQSGSLTLIR